MAKKDKCYVPLWLGIATLVAGVLFLIRDLGYWNFWGIREWTVLFLLLGLWFAFPKD